MVTTLTKTTAPGSYAAAGVAITMTAADAGAGNQFISTGRELVIAHNTGIAERHITITSVINAKNRLGTITDEHIAAGAYRVFGPFKVDGWRQSTRYLLLSADHAEVLFGIIVLPE